MNLQPKCWDFLVGAFDVPFEVVIIPEPGAWEFCQVVRTARKEVEKLGLCYEFLHHERPYRCTQGEITVEVQSHFGRDAFTVSCGNTALKDVSRAHLVEVITRFLEPGAPPPAVPRLPAAPCEILTNSRCVGS